MKRFIGGNLIRDCAQFGASLDTGGGMPMAAKKNGSYSDLISSPLSDELDEFASGLIRFEDERQLRKVILIASESICPKPVSDVVASTFTNLYAEGLPGLRMAQWDVEHLEDLSHHLSYTRRYTDRRYYKGCDYVNFFESLAQRRCAEVFANDLVGPDDIYVNVQPLSGAAANNAVYMACVDPGDTVMGMALDSGGHLSHGSPVNRSGKYHRVEPYTVDPVTSLLNYDLINERAQKVKPKLIIAGYSAYPRDIDWKAFKEISEDVGATLLADIAHPAGLVAAGEFPNPVGIADVVTFTTHKTMCGPRGAIVLSTDPDLAKELDMAVFPGEQGGPHQNVIAGKAVAFQIAKGQAFREMQHQVKVNARIVGETFEKEGLGLAYGGTDCHYVMVDLDQVPTPTGEHLKGEIVARVLDMCGITLNKNTKAGDTSAVHPSAIRIGTTFMTQQGWGEEEFVRLAKIISKLLQGIHAYHYMGANKPRGRGKMDIMLYEQGKRDVEQLMRESGILSADDIVSGYPHYHRIPGNPSGQAIPLVQGRVPSGNGLVAVDASAHGVMRILGSRARQFMQAAVTANVWKLAPDQSTRAFVLDNDGNILDDVVVIREQTDDRGRESFLVLTHKGGHDRVLGWFRYISDGYILIDPADLHLKVDGPVVVEDLSDPKDRRMVLMALKGKGAVKASGQLRSGRALDMGQAEVVELGRAKALMNRSTWGGSDGFEVVCSLEDCRTVWEMMLAVGAAPAKGMALTSESSSLKDAPAGMIDPQKPYFVGQAVVDEELGTVADKEPWVWSDPGRPPRKSCLNDWHNEHTKTIVPFAGWLMPVWYTKISEEHAAVRNTAGLFDVSHMGVFQVRGADAERFLDLVTSQYIPLLAPGDASYAYLMGPDGIPIDDVFVYRLAQDEFMMVVNAANAEKDWDWLKAVIERRVIIDEHRPWVEIDVRDFQLRDLKDPRSGRDQRVDLSLQGPRSTEILLECIVDDAMARALMGLERSKFIKGPLAGVSTIISRTGYTGEETGYELYVHPDDARQLWESLLKAGRPHGLIPCGLGARDSTRTEAGYPLYGHELAGDYDLTPLEAGYPQFVRLHKPFFVGRRPQVEREAGWKMSIARFGMLRRGIPVVKPGSPVTNRQGHVVGHVTSCATTSDGSQVGMAYIQHRYCEEGSRLHVFVPPRGKGPEAKAVHALEVGDRMHMAEEAVVLARFMVPPEEDEDSE
jgi:glycine cleavage system T protein